MKFIDSLNLFGIHAKQIPTIILHGAPTTSTEGAVGVLGMDVDSPDYMLYKCVDVSDGVYTWQLAANTTGGSGMPEVTEENNGQIGMVVDGVWSVVDFPAGTQYDMETITIPASEWNDNGSQIHYIWYNESSQGNTRDLTGCDIDVSLLSTSTKEQFEAAAESGVYCAGSTGGELEFRCLYSIPTVDLSFSIRITTPRTLSYTVNEESMTMTIVEE